jgi:hypothetical protein
MAGGEPTYLVMRGGNPGCKGNCPLVAFIVKSLIVTLPVAEATEIVGTIAKVACISNITNKTIAEPYFFIKILLR